MRLFVPLLLLCACTPGWAASKPAAKEYFVYIGGYTNTGKSKGIGLFRFDASTGKLTPEGLAAEVANPSWVHIHPNGRFLYSVSEISSMDGQKTGAITAFQIDKTSGKLTMLNRVPSKGAGPCYVKTDATGKMVLAANYGSGSVTAIPVKEDGSLGEPAGFRQHQGSSVNPKRQSEPHAHSANYSPDNRFAIVADLGLDKLMVYRIDPAKASLEPNDPPFFSVAPGSGPRHFTFHPNGKVAYVINELASTVTVMSYDKARGAFHELQTVRTLPADFKGDSTTAEVQAHPSGKFLYGSNRGHDSIAVFTVAKDGRLKLVENVPTQGKTPRNFSLDPSGRWLIAANQNTGNLAVYRVDGRTGRLTPTGQSEPAGAPVCVKFLAVR